MNQVNALRAPLGNMHNMEMKSAITKKRIFWNNSLQTGLISSRKSQNLGFRGQGT